MTSKARQVGLFRDHDHTICFAHCCCDGLFIEWSERAQFDNLDSSALGVNDVGSSGAGLQHHRAAGNNGEATRTFANTQVTCFSYRQGIVSIRDIPPVGYGRNNIALIIFWWLGTIEASPLQKGDRRLCSGRFEQQALSVKRRGRTDGNHTRDSSKALLARVRLAESPPTSSAVGDRATTP